MLFTVFFFNLIAGWYLHGSRSTSAKKLFEEFQNNPSEAMHVKSDTSNENSETVAPPHQNIFLRVFSTYDKLFILLVIIGSLNSGYINLY